MNFFGKYSTNQFAFQKGEKIEMVVRHHWIFQFFILVRWFFWGPLMMGGLIVGIYFLFPAIFATKIMYLVLYFICIYLLFYTLGSYIRWVNSVFDIFFVTSQRVININQVDFFHRTLTETRLKYIQDATGSVRGFLNTLFNFGTITIMTASNTANIVMNEVENPGEKARRIFLLAHQYRNVENKQAGDSDGKILEDTDYQSPFFQDLRIEMEEVLLKK